MRNHVGYTDFKGHLTTQELSKNPEYLNLAEYESKRYTNDYLCPNNPC